MRSSGGGVLPATRARAGGSATRCSRRPLRCEPWARRANTSTRCSRSSGSWRTVLRRERGVRSRPSPKGSRASTAPGAGPPSNASSSGHRHRTTNGAGTVRVGELEAELTAQAARLDRVRAELQAARSDIDRLTVELEGARAEARLPTESG